MVQEYLNEISPTLHGPNKLKTLGKPLRIADLQPPASGQDNPATRRLSQTKVTFHKVINVLHKKKKTNFGILDGKLDFHQIEPNIYSSALLFNWGTLGVIIVTSNAALANIVSLNQRK